MSFKDLYKRVEYCGIDLARIDPRDSQVKVCNGRDYYSQFSYKELIERNSHLPFFERVKREYPKFTNRQIGTFIRWLYRGMTFEQAAQKVFEDFKKARYCQEYKKSLKAKARR